MQPRDVVIVSACRTAIGKFQGQFKDVPARELAITAGKEAIRRAGVDINTSDEIVMGECYTAMQGSLPARQVSMRIGLPIESSAVTVNQNCASGMRALEIACNNIQLGKTEIGLVVGVENMLIFSMISRNSSSLSLSMWGSPSPVRSHTSDMLNSRQISAIVRSLGSFSPDTNLEINDCEIFIRAAKSVFVSPLSFTHHAILLLILSIYFTSCLESIKTQEMK